MKKDLSKMNEKELGKFKVPTPDSEEELMKIIHTLAERDHDYGTCVHAMSISATAAFNYISRKLGVTGFQASCADMNILTRTRDLKAFQIVNMENLLYPQYCNEEHFPSWQALTLKNAKWLKKEAAKNLKKSTDIHPNVKQHWEKLARLEVRNEK